jgi:hypothetical protein
VKVTGDRAPVRRRSPHLYVQLVGEDKDESAAGVRLRLVCWNFLSQWSPNRETGPDSDYTRADDRRTTGACRVHGTGPQPNESVQHQRSATWTEVDQRNGKAFTGGLGDIEWETSFKTVSTQRSCDA